MPKANNIMLNYENDIKGSFDILTVEQKELVMEIVANFHYRDGTLHDDGSKGTIKITNRQFNDCLAVMKKKHRFPTSDLDSLEFTGKWDESDPDDWETFKIILYCKEAGDNVDDPKKIQKILKRAGFKIVRI